MTIKPAKSEEWRSPLWLFRHFEKRFGRFDVDACASKTNSLCDSFFTKDFPFEKAELMSIEEAHVWCNPPYNAKALETISRHIIKLSMESAATNNHLIACLLVPAKTDQAWCHYCFKVATEINLIKGRLKFQGAKDSAQQSHLVFCFDSRFLFARRIVSLSKESCEK